MCIASHMCHGHVYGRYMKVYRWIACLECAFVCAYMYGPLYRHTCLVAFMYVHALCGCVSAGLCICGGLQEEGKSGNTPSSRADKTLPSSTGCGLGTLWPARPGNPQPCLISMVQMGSRGAQGHWACLVPTLLSRWTLPMPAASPEGCVVGFRWTFWLKRGSRTTSGAS